MSVYLPRNLAGLAALASREQGRYALAAIRVLDPDNGLYRCEATDGRLLGVVQGPMPEAAYPSLEDAGDGPAEVLVPATAWVQAFRLGDKRRPVGIGAGEGKVVLAVSDQAVTLPSVDGRFPDVNAILPKHGPLVSLRVKPELLIELLKVAASVEPGGGVTLFYYGKGKPLGLSTNNEQGQTFDALLMPLS